MMFEWEANQGELGRYEGDIDDDAICRTEDGYLMHCERLGEESCHCWVGKATGRMRTLRNGKETPEYEDVFSTAETDVRALGMDDARMLAEMAVIAHRNGWRPPCRR